MSDGIWSSLKPGLLTNGPGLLTNGQISNSGGFAVRMDVWDRRGFLSPSGKSAQDTIFWLVCPLSSTRVYQLPEHEDISCLSAVYSDPLDPSQAHSRCSGKAADAH